MRWWISRLRTNPRDAQGMHLVQMPIPLVPPTGPGFLFGVPINALGHYSEDGRQTPFRPIMFSWQLKKLVMSIGPLIGPVAHINNGHVDQRSLRWPLKSYSKHCVNAL